MIISTKAPSFSKVSFLDSLEECVRPVRLAKKKHQQSSESLEASSKEITRKSAEQMELSRETSRTADSGKRRLLLTAQASGPSTPEPDTQKSGEYDLKLAGNR